MTKYAANAMLAARISFMDEVANLCDRVGADVHKVRMGIGTDGRIGPSFLFPGVGYGGSCFPKDVRALVDILESQQLNANLFRAIDQVNEQHKKSHIGRLRRWHPDLHGVPVAVWGLSFKPRTDDIRESPALTVIEQLLEHGARVSAYDPEAMANARRIFPQIHYAATPYEAVEGTVAILVLTEWDVFRNIDLGRVKSLMREPAIIDLRNIYEPQELRQLGFRYSGMGRD
jgi:UDPglucose 6-dehydrogenase